MHSRKVALEILLGAFSALEILSPCQDRSLARGVRSDAQLSCTETRFQKCSQSGKNGSKNPMLSLSMVYNVISCKQS